MGGREETHLLDDHPHKSFPMTHKVRYAMLEGENSTTAQNWFDYFSTRSIQDN